MTPEDRVYEWFSGRGGAVVLVVGLTILFAGLAYGLLQ